MSVLSKIVNRIRGAENKPGNVRGQRLQNRRYSGAVQAARFANGSSAWAGTTNDDMNQEYMQSMEAVQRRAQDLDVNNPDVHGFHRARTAQVIGRGVFFKSAPHPAEVNISPEETQATAEKINRLKRLHSRLGGFDSSGRGYSEGKQQERAVLTMFVTGKCLIHRVWDYDRKLPVPLRLELISGSRLTTPYFKAGDPLVSFGIQYSDSFRTKISGYWVRKVFQTRGDSFIPLPEWDFLPAEDTAMLSLTEMAGLDQALPLSLSLVRMLRNRGEFIEKAVESARAQANIYMQLECAPGVDPWNAASDDQDQVANTANPDPTENTVPFGFMSLGGQGSVQALYSPAGEKVNWNSARLPEPDFKGFMDATDQRCARGFVSSLSRFTRTVNGSWAGGRMEQQQDDPVVDQIRESFTSAWQRVHEWFVEALWISSVINIPGYNDDTRCYWTEYRAEFPGQVDINPQDTAKARQISFSLRTLTPQQACEQDGKDLHTNLQSWAAAMVAVRKAEKDYGLPAGSLDFVVAGKASDLSSPETDQAPDDQEKVNQNRRRFERVSLNGRRAHTHA